MRPLPSPDSLTAPYWEAAAEGRLALQQCVHCQAFAHPPRARCTVCLSPDLAWRTLSGKATLYSFCIMHTPLVAGLTPPHTIGWIEPVEQPGLLLVANIKNGDSPVRIGMPLEVVFESVEDGVTLPRFIPAQASPAGASSAP